MFIVINKKLDYTIKVKRRLKLGPWPVMVFTQVRQFFNIKKFNTNIFKTQIFNANFLTLELVNTEILTLNF